MNMGRKKSKRSTKNTTRQKTSDTSSGNAASAANIGGGSSGSTSRNVASSDAVRSISPHSTSRYASDLNPDDEHKTLHTVLGSTATVTTLPRNSTAFGRPEAGNRLANSTLRNSSISDRSSQSNRKVSSQTLRNSNSAVSVSCLSSQSIISVISTAEQENQRSSSEIVSGNLAAVRDTLQSTARDTAFVGAARGGPSRSKARSTASVGAAQGGPSRSKARSTAPVGATQGRALHSKANDKSSASPFQVRSTTRNAVSFAMPAYNRNITEDTAPSAANVGGTSSRSTVRRISSRTTSSYASSELNPDSELLTVETTFGSTSIIVPRDSAASGRPEAESRLTHSTSRNSLTSVNNTRNNTRDSPLLQTSTSCHGDSTVFPVFYVIRTVDESAMSELSEIRIDMFISNLLGRQDVDITKLNDGSLLVKVKSRSEGLKISNITSLLNEPVTVSSHRGLNSSQGTIYSGNLLGYSDEQILNALRSQHVTKVYRFRRKVNGTPVKTSRVLLDFSIPHPPSEVRLGHTSLQVRLFSPTPRRCFNCQSFEHISKYCSATPVCPLCGETGHTYPPRCNKPLKCINCAGDHAATSSDCPTFKMEKKVRDLHVREKIGIYEARIKIREQVLRGELQI